MVSSTSDMVVVCFDHLREENLLWFFGIFGISHGYELSNRVLLFGLAPVDFLVLPVSIYTRHLSR